MSAFSLRLPNSLHQKLKEVAAREGISINQLLTTAAAEKLSALTTEEYLRERASRGSKARFKKTLKKIPSGRPSAKDKRGGA